MNLFRYAPADDRGCGEGDLDQLPARLVLNRLPVPVLAVESGGAIVFANPALAELLGYIKESLLQRSVRQILRDLPGDEPALPFLHRHAGRVVTLSCAQGGSIQATMSPSILRRAADQVALVAFEPSCKHLIADKAQLRLV
jgi:PAS domain S-box-containing protein